MAERREELLVTEFLGGGPLGELKFWFGVWGLGGRGRPARSEVLACPSGSLPRSVVRHVGMEVALCDSAAAPTAASVAAEAGLDEPTVELALEILAGITGTRLPPPEVRGR